MTADILRSFKIGPWALHPRIVQEQVEYHTKNGKRIVVEPGQIIATPEHSSGYRWDIVEHRRQALHYRRLMVVEGLRNLRAFVESIEAHQPPIRYLEAGTTKKMAAIAEEVGFQRVRGREVRIIGETSEVTTGLRRRFPRASR